MYNSTYEIISSSVNAKRLLNISTREINAELFMNFHFTNTGSSVSHCLQSYLFVSNKDPTDFNQSAVK